MTAEPKLSTAAFEHPALDYAFLRQEGIRHLESLAGHVWTDFNTHDPGITILEQLCYAITDLAYRASHDVPDLLASGGDPYRSLYSAATILTSHAVTRLDLRKLVIDINGVKNAWIEDIAEPAPVLHAQADKRELRFLADPPYTVPVLRKGLLRVLIETSDLQDRPVVDVQRDVARRLAANRPLCADFDEIRVLRSQPVRVDAEIEIGQVDDAEGVLLAIYEVLSEAISPSLAFSTLGEMLAAGKRTDEIFDGPALDHGFLDSAALESERMSRKDAIYTSDLIREIMSVPGVRAVRSLTVSVSSNPEREPWRLALDGDRTPRLDLSGSSFILVKGRLAAKLDTDRIIDALVKRREQAAPRRLLAPGERDFLPPAGRDRNVDEYRSIQHHLPTVYGVGAAGLPSAATDRRQAQARQLKAYLLFFDQLLGSYFAQLAHAGSLFSFHERDARTYVTRMVEDDELGLSEIRRLDAAAHRLRLEAIMEDGGASGSLSNRRNRFLNHLMARFAEQFTDYSLVLLGAATRAPLTTDDRLIPDKQALLQRYPRISSARGTGMDILSPAGDAAGDGAVSGLQERIERKLGLSQAADRIFLVEHVLLAPMSDDDVPPGPPEYRPLPFFSDAVLRDPFSLQLSVVLPGWRGLVGEDSAEVAAFHQLVEQTVREETPAHLTPYVHWLDREQWPLFESAYAEWRAAYSAYRAVVLGLESMSVPGHVRARDARDRVIDLLAFATTYPLRDLPVRDEQLTVPFNQPAKIPIELSQRGVIYELRRQTGGALSQVEGTGGTILLSTPAMREDTTFNILARKPATGREAYLLQQATVKVGLDVRLAARIVVVPRLVDPLVPRSDAPADGDARIVAWGTRVQVQIDHSQEGVDYRLVQIGGQEQVLSPDVRGNLGDIVLTAAPATEDIDLRIRATKVFDPSENRPAHTDLLEVVLPLKVRAKLDLAVAPGPRALLDFATDGYVQVEATQATAAYTAYVRTVSDREFVFGPPTPDLLFADVDSEPRVHVLRPPRREIWEDLEGFQEVGAALPGNGGSLRLPLPRLRQDSVILVRARKDHRHGAVTVPSSVQLANAALILVRPDPRPALRIGVVMEGARTSGTLELTGGQPGVFYQVRLTADGEVLGLPAYFHKTDEREPAQNKGVDQLRIEVDVAISRGTQQVARTPVELATTPPLPPLVDTAPLDAGATLHLRAIKAQTRAMVRLPLTARITAVPSIVVDPAIVPNGTPAKIMVRASVAGDRYQLTLDGQPVGQARDGNGSDLTFTTGSLTQSTRFQMLVTRPGEQGIAVQRTAVVVVSVAPPGP